MQLPKQMLMPIKGKVKKIHAININLDIAYNNYMEDIKIAINA